MDILDDNDLRPEEFTFSDLLDEIEEVKMTLSQNPTEELTKRLVELEDLKTAMMGDDDV